jgi:hypothetical protein
MYRDALKCINDNATKPPVVTPELLREQHTNLGGVDNKKGENRPENNTDMANIDLTAFQVAAVIALFALMAPLTKAQNKEDIAEHLATVPHKPF